MPISVLICCHNGERFLRDTLDSVLGQTIQPLEVLVVDDGSTDASAQIVESYGDPVRVIRQHNQGLPASRNVAISAARGDYLFFIDADDLIHPTSFERLRLAAGDDPNAVAIMGFASFHEQPDSPFFTRRFAFTSFFPEIITGNFGPQHNRLLRRDLVLRAGCFDPTMFLFEDWLFWCRVALCDARLVPVDFTGAYYRRHAKTMSDTASPIASIKGHIRVMEELSQGMLLRPDLLANYGEPLFWGCWTAIHRGRQHDVSWEALRRLVANTTTIVQRGPESLRRSAFVSLVRLVGFRWAERARSLISRTDENK